MAEPSPFGEKEDFAARLKRLRGTEDKRSGPTARDGNARSGMALGMRIATELVAAVAVGAGIGVLLDSWLATKPWLLIVFTLLGVAGGMLNVYRLATGQSRAAGFGPAPKSGADESQDKER